MIKKLFSFNGRSGRFEFLIILALQACFLVIIRILRQQTAADPAPAPGYTLFTFSLLFFVILYLRIAVTARRLRDTELSQYYLLLPLSSEFFPFLGFTYQQLYFLMLLTLILTGFLLLKKGTLESRK